MSDIEEIDTGSSVIVIRRREKWTTVANYFANQLRAMPLDWIQATIRLSPFGLKMVVRVVQEEDECE